MTKGNASAKQIIKELLAALPDSVHNDNKSWEWAWDELDNEAQEAVKQARRNARLFLKRLKEEK